VKLMEGSSGDEGALSGLYLEERGRPLSRPLSLDFKPLRAADLDLSGVGAHRATGGWHRSDLAELAGPWFMPRPG
jgi:hypothetical protein